MSRVLAIEEWRAAPESPGYEVSRGGEVRAVKTGRRLKQWAHKSGHQYLRLGRGKSYQVHHLVLASFGVDRPAGLECRHLDGNPSNNRLDNLQWGTRIENIEDLKATSGRYAKASLSDEEALRIKRSFNGKHGDQSRIAREFGVALCAVNRIIRGGSYAHLGA